MTSLEHHLPSNQNARTQDLEALLLSAQELQRKGEFSAAENAYRELVFNGLPGATAWLGLGQCVRTRGDRQLALTYFLAGHAVEPSNPWPILEAAGEFLTLGQTKRAITAYTKGIAAFPQNVEAHLGLGRCLKRIGQIEGALTQFNAAITLAPENKAIRLELAALLEEMGLWDEAEAAYKTATPDGRLPADFSIARGQQARKNNDRNAALRYFQDAVAAAPENHWANLEAGCEMLALGRPKEALAFYMAGIALAPDLSATHLGAGRCLRILGSRVEALQHFREAAALAPDDKYAQLEWAAEARDAGDFATALEAANKVLALQPNNTDALASIALTARASGQPERAVATLHSIPLTGPEQIPLLLDLAAEEYSLGLLAAANEHLALARHIAPDHPALLQHLAAQAMRAGKPDEARTLYQRAAAVAPEDLTPQLGLLDAVAASGHPDEALALATQLQGRFGEQPILLAKIIFLHRLAGDYHTSLHLAHRATSAFPQYFWIASERVQTELLICDAAEVAHTLLQMSTFGPRESALRLCFRAALHEREMALDEAAALYRQASELSPDNADLQWALTRVNLLLMNLTEATEHLRRFVELSRPLLALQQKSTNISQTHYGQILDDFRLDADLVQQLRALRGLSPKSRIPALVQLVAQAPESIAAAVALMIALRQNGALGQPAVPGPNPIPEIIMQYWNDSTVPADVEALTQSWRRLHPGMPVVRYNDATARAFLAQEFPPEVLRAYTRALEPAQKADIFRLAWLERHGGIYTDADNRCLEPIAPLLPAGATLVLYQEDLATLGNDFIAAAPGHPVISWALAQAVAALNRGDTDLVWLSTGPGLMTRAVAQAVAAASASGMALPPGLHVHARHTMLRAMARNCMLAYRATSRNWVVAAFGGEGAERDTTTG
ncbi:tetratricopeptide repeat protein [Acidocella sp. KAb 2-4]|uniref:tetratricopeptide repeat protein n=1 Tax=Acidocella sp. KAb 2-4 TaxID=2885158 RepID=UPI001D088EE0|nr:tetratricopeptide repeat protein [Acidocella sp. KAb 2-4]MCB5944214.1 tetratricopeptide repeat protein [Acidocella sp. KAb 2-4]